MRNKLEESWKDLQGKVLHVQVTGVEPWSDQEINVQLEILELGETVNFQVITNE